MERQQIPGSHCREEAGDARSHRREDGTGRQGPRVVHVVGDRGTRGVVVAATVGVRGVVRSVGVTPPVGSEEGLFEVRSCVDDRGSRQGEKRGTGHRRLGFRTACDGDGGGRGGEQRTRDRGGAVDHAEQGFRELRERGVGQGEDGTRIHLNADARALGDAGIAHDQVHSRERDGGASIVVTGRGLAGEPELRVFKNRAAGRAFDVDRLPVSGGRDGRRTVAVAVGAGRVVSKPGNDDRSVGRPAG